MFAALLVIFISGIGAYFIPLAPQFAARLQSRYAARRMAWRLRNSGRLESVDQAVKALRTSREVEIQPVEAKMADRAGLDERIQKIRLRGMAKPQRPGTRFGKTALERPVLNQCLRLQVAPKTSPNLC